MSIDGTNKYDAWKLVPSETIVSRTLQSKNRFWSNVIWRAGKPALDSEWNLINDMAMDSISNLIRSSTPSGWCDLGNNKYSTGNSGVSNNIQFYSSTKEIILDVPNALVNGWPLIVGGVDYTDTSINSITLAEADAALGSQRYDFVFLEVWRAQVRSRDQNNVKIAQNKPSLTEVYAYGNVQYGGTNFADDIVDPAIKPSTDGIETSERVQIQYRIRTVSGVSFANDLACGFDDTAKVQGQGANANPQVASYSFTNMKDILNDSGLWRAGNGDDASRTALRCVDGYTYAIPMFKIYRRSKVSYDDSGVSQSLAYDYQQGNSASLLSGVSDRPDGKFYDGIDATDIVDLRAKVSLGEMNLDQILEKNLHLLLSGDLESIRKPTLQYDSIADADIYGYDDFRSNEGCSGKRMIWSDTATDQTNIFSRINTTTTNNSLDVYVIKNSVSPNWDGSGGLKDQIKVQTTIKLPSGTVVKVTPRIYVEQKDLSVNLSTTSGSWSGLNLATATFTFSVNLGHSKSLWIYYDITLPVGQGLTHVPNSLQKIKYTNYSAIGVGTVVRGEILMSVPNRMQDLANHVFENTVETTVYNEIETVKQRKQITIHPLVQTTTTRNGGTRTLDSKTTSAIGKYFNVPFPIQHLRGVYTSATGGTELAMQSILNTQPTSVNVSEDYILINENYYVADMTSLKYDPTGAFVGGETELLVTGGGAYNPVYEHQRTTAVPIGSRVKLYNNSGVIYDIPVGTSAANFRWSGKRTRSRGGSGYGYDINGTVIDCTLSDNNGSFSGFTDGQQLWIDMDYFCAPHQGASIRTIYEHTPYQGFDVGGQEIKMVHRREKGLFFNNGTGGGLIENTASGTSSSVYTPVSTKLPGSFQDFLRNGSVINIASNGVKRFNSDLWFGSSYEVYGYYGGGSLWVDSYIMPINPQTTSRGFLANPFLEVIFEDPTVDQANAEFVLTMLVVNKETNELYLFVQIGNHGNQKLEAGLVRLELYRLNEKTLWNKY